MASPSERQEKPAPGTKRAHREEHARPKQPERTAAARRREPAVRWGAIAAVALVAVGVVAWLGLGRLLGNEGAPSGLPEPEGGPQIAQDVGTLVGQPAPSFTLTDSEGQSHAITPGQGRPLVLVSHMGIT
jgi:hypothetical protein